MLSRQSLRPDGYWRTHSISQYDDSAWVQELGTGSESRLLDQRRIHPDHLGRQVVESPNIGAADFTVYFWQFCQLLFGLDVSFVLLLDKAKSLPKRLDVVVPGQAFEPHSPRMIA
jgi:hypothetical protein